jgi:hypothetical protein
VADPPAGTHILDEPVQLAYVGPLPVDAEPELDEQSETLEGILGSVPNSLLTMQRKPAIVEGFDTLTRAIMAECGEVDPGLNRLAAPWQTTPPAIAAVRPTRWSPRRSTG